MIDNTSSRIPEKQDFTTRVSWKKSLKVRFTLIFIIVQLLLGGITMFALSYIYQERIDTEYIDQATVISKFTASLVEGETLDRYLETLEKDAEYERLSGIMRTLKNDSGVKYLYISRVIEGGEIFIFDADETETYSDLGVRENWALIDYEDNDIMPRLLRGERVKPYITNSSKWGWLVSVYEPIYRIDGSVAAYAGVDISMEEIMRERTNMFILVGAIILIIFLISIALNISAVQRYLISPVRMLVTDMEDYRLENRKLSLRLRSGDELELLERAMIDMEYRIDSAMTDLKSAEELTNLMVDTYPLCCHIWNSKHEIIDCNKAAVKLYGLNSKQEFKERFFEFMPEYQPDGRFSGEKAEVFLKKAFEENIFRFEWMHKLPDGSPLPAEVTLVRVNHGDDYLIVGYTRDLRDITQMEIKIHELEAEVDKIYYDALTGIYNRRYFDWQLDKTIQSLSRSKDGTLSIMMIDIDKFKNYNDTYGHSEGDKCLKAVAETIAQTVTRDDDFAVRYGGEEFAIVLPNTDENGARMIAERIIENIARKNIPHKQNPAAAFVTVSVGVATGKADHTKSMEYYIKAADDMLYQSKENGRNRYTFCMC